ncbi:hypothetical protein FISHEDRAFT_79105 [Fistulina hepatica ATCC 64428]|uniref:Uncharacterized protein n=1 Tax=Fistulina hepatica ATCC 64428 TaxID=1128425 RepID=A0A0D7A0B3_9AGAR|nr:hypothetical protein FISHEDRAFT_79105 [Fistulina hepatica ATCC 64428]
MSQVPHSDAPAGTPVSTPIPYTANTSSGHAAPLASQAVTFSSTQSNFRLRQFQGNADGDGIRFYQEYSYPPSTRYMNDTIIIYPVTCATHVFHNPFRSAAINDKYTASSNATLKKSGRGRKTLNFKLDEIDVLLDVVEELLPGGSQAFDWLGEEFNKRAESLGLHTRDTAALKRKFLRMVNTCMMKKPTGKSKKDRQICRAGEIHRTLLNKFGVSVLDDPNLANLDASDDDAVGDDSEGPQTFEVSDEENTRAKTTVAEHRYTREIPLDRPVHGRHPQSAQLFERLAGAFDPEHLARHDQQREESNVLLLQFAAQSEEMNRLRAENSRLRDHIMELEVRAARAEDKLAYERHLSELLYSHLHRRRCHHSPSESSDSSHSCLPSKRQLTSTSTSTES